MPKKKKYIIASLNTDEDYDTAYPIDIITIEYEKLGDVFDWYRSHFKYSKIYRANPPISEFKYQTHTAWHLGDT